jgi:putative flippase GtrA
MLNRWVSQGSKFAVIGAGATFVHFTTLTLLIEGFRIPWPTVATAIGCGFGIMTSYLGNYMWTFARNEPHREFIGRFVCVYLLSMMTNTLVFALQVGVLGFHYIPAFFMATVISTSINFAFCKFVVFERNTGLMPPFATRLPKAQD